MNRKGGAGVRTDPSGALWTQGASNLDQSEEDQERRTLGEIDRLMRDEKGEKEELFEGRVSATPWSQMQRLTQKEGQGQSTS